MKLRYKISNWNQLTECKSNNSRDLSIKVTEFIENRPLRGTRITVYHKKFGDLFTCIVNPKGTMVSEFSDTTDFVFEFTPAMIIAELKKWGFIIQYEIPKSLPASMIKLLMTVNNLGYDKIRILNIFTYNISGEKEFDWKPVAFNIEDNPDWINPGYSPSEKEFLDSLSKGTAFNLFALGEAKNLNWSWLYNCVESIDDILQDNANSQK